MGLSDLNGAHSDADDIEQEEQSLAKKCAHLEQELAAAKKRALDAEDTLRLKSQLLDDLERSLAVAQDRANSLADQVSARELDLRLLRQDMDKHPVSDADLLHRYQKQAELIELLEETLTCPICYVPFSRGQAVSLLCGHVFCEPCFKAWEVKHALAWKASPQQGAYHGAECPECRSQDVRRGRVRIFALEEVVRLVERGISDLKKPHYSAPEPPPTPPAEPFTSSDVLDEHFVQASPGVTNQSPESSLAMEIDSNHSSSADPDLIDEDAAR
ncbi:hypothetical protein OIV83_003943 [Microbotryomycetes sp. JL201]|nr:hypothetical protein OIV83_003943 [Microbotryomycetes sp. JL201]